MVDSILFWLAFYLVYSLNLSVLTAMIKDGYFDHKFFTRSIRGVFMCPPFGLIAFFLVFLKQSIGDNFRNFLFVMEKRKDTDF